MQEDIKKLIAYSSVAHMGFVTMGIFAGTTQGVAGGVFQMVSHGIVSGALFLCVGIVYDRMHTREIAAYGGLVNRMPLYALVFMVFTMANVGLPGTSGFVGEFMTLLGTFKVSIPTATFATLGVILSAAYALWLYRKVVFGALTKPSLASIKDLTFRESLTLFPLVALTILFGVYPKPVLDMSAASVQQLVNNYNTAVTAVKAAALVKAGLFTLAVIGVLTSVVGAFYYLTIIKVMYFDEPAGQLDPMRIELRTVLAVAGIFNIFFFVYPGPLVSVATAAAKSLF